MAQPTTRTRKALLDSATELLSRKPRATLAEIASAAGVGRATLYRHFKSREQLIEILAEQALDDTDRACAQIDYYGQSAKQSLRETIEAIVPLGSRYAFLAFQNVSEHDDTPVGARLRTQGEQLRQLVVAARQEGAFGLDVPVAWIVAATDALLYAGWNSVRSGDVAPKDVANLIVRTLERGLE